MCNRCVTAGRVSWSWIGQSHCHHLPLPPTYLGPNLQEKLTWRWCDSRNTSCALQPCGFNQPFMQRENYLVSVAKLALFRAPPARVILRARGERAPRRAFTKRAREPAPPGASRDRNYLAHLCSQRWASCLRVVRRFVCVLLKTHHF